MKTVRECRLPKSERLHSKKLIEALLSEGNVLFHYPYKIYFRIEEVAQTDSPCSFVVVVPKRNFKRAVHRNLIKRRIREAYRKNKFIIHDALLVRNVSLHFLLRYVSNEPLPYTAIEQAMQATLGKLATLVAGYTDISISAAD